jgi:hypothetical protein
MISLKGKLRAALALCGLMGAFAVTAAADPVLEPFTCEIVTGTTATCPTDPTFSSPSAGIFELWVENGDNETPRVTSGSVTVNGTVVLSDAAFAAGRELIAHPVTLLAGNNTIGVTVNGDPGQFLTVMILHRGQRPDLTIGRLLVPYAVSSNLVLDLKNGSHDGGRGYRVVFYDAAGNYAADSGHLTLAPRASLSQAVSTFIVNGGWTAGSIEIFYAGRGRGRLFGQVSTTDPTTAVSSIVTMSHAGSRVLDPHDLARRQ